MSCAYNGMGIKTHLTQLFAREVAYAYIKGDIHQLLHTNLTSY